MDSNNYRQSKGKSTYVRCRICHKSILKQNYGKHIQSLHPAEDSRNLSVLGQTQLSFSAKPEKSVKLNNESECGSSADSNNSNNLNNNETEPIIAYYKGTDGNFHEHADLVQPSPNQPNNTPNIILRKNKYIHNKSFNRFFQEKVLPSLFCS